MFYQAKKCLIKKVEKVFKIFLKSGCNLKQNKLYITISKNY